MSMALIDSIHQQTANLHLNCEREDKGSSEDNYLKRFVQWIRVDRPAYQQYLVYTSVAIVSIALIASIVGIPIALRLLDESRKTKLINRVHLEDNRVYEAIGGKQKYMQLPELRFPKAIFDENYAVQPSQMKASIMRGTFTYKRPCLALKLIDRANGVKFVQVLHRKFTYSPTWDYTRGENTPFVGHDVDDRAVDIVKEIVQGTHAHYRLA